VSTKDATRVPPPPEELVVEVGTKCGGCGRKLPLRTFREAIAFFKSLVDRGIEVPGNLTMNSFQCSRCGSFTILTARALRYARET
jgi:predicted RNA-binding Zn-ribbon protein involved in translation (DUF1610 family)